MMKTINGKQPRVDETAFIAPTADVLGDVTIGPESSIWYQAVLRADINFIRIGSQTNIQDQAVIHVDHREGEGCTVGDRVVVGHGAILHSCTVEDDCLIGMGSIVLPHAVVEKGAMVGAGAVVSPGKRIPAGMLAVGIPAKPIRPLTEEELAANRASCNRYLKAMAVHQDQNLVIDFAKET